MPKYRKVTIEGPRPTGGSKLCSYCLEEGRVVLVCEKKRRRHNKRNHSDQVWLIPKKRG